MSFAEAMSESTPKKTRNVVQEPSEEDDFLDKLLANSDSDEDADNTTSSPSFGLTPPSDTDTDTNTPQASMAENPFESEASQVLFEALDQLHTCNAKHYIDVPQLVIVGGQSVGKSSLLQSLTGIPFAVGTGCCTRFATRIVSRRSEPGTDNQVHISITTPDFEESHFDYEPNVDYANFNMYKNSISTEEFTEIVNKVSSDYLGIKPGKGHRARNFASEVLKIEISGPNRSYFSILDLPGVVQNATKIRESEMAGIRNLLSQYMRKDDNIVICVADAAVDLDNQVIFQMARKHVHQSRLIGVFTKCDSLENARQVVDIVNGTEDDGDDGDDGGDALNTHGWFVVRNKKESDTEDANFNLDAVEEELFSRPAWSKISPARRGSAQLKRYLGQLLSQKMRDAFPRILVQARELRQSAFASLDRLGPERMSVYQQRAYLAELAQKYESLAKQSLHDPWHLARKECQVRYRMRDASEQFSAAIRNGGHTHEFENHASVLDDYRDTLQSIVFFGNAEGETSGESRNDSKKAKSKGAKQATRADSSAALFEKVREEVSICSCTELPGMVHPDVIHRLYRMQTAKWQRIAEDYLREIATTVLIAVQSFLAQLCASSNNQPSILHEELTLTMQQLHEAALAKSLTELDSYCNGNRSKLLQTTDPEFEEKLQLMRTIRLSRSVLKVMELSKFFELNKAAGDTAISKRELFNSLFQQCHHSTIDNTVNDVHDTLKAYYEVALKQFIAHITNNIVEDFVQSSDGALYGLSVQYIHNLPESEVQRLGAETRSVVAERRDLRERITTLEAAEETARIAMARTAALR